MSVIRNKEKTRQQLQNELAKAHLKISKLEDFYGGMLDVDEYKNLAIEVLKLLNESDKKLNLIRKLLFLIKEFTGFKAVGIRLKEEEDFPYYETNGFPEDFVELERNLCSVDASGNLIRDSKGNAVLECMCGNIISGKTDPSLSFFTEGGSFWTNSTTDLHTSTIEEGYPILTRIRCVERSYESMALFPLRYGSDIIGLLQLNDHRRNMFSSRLINFIEGIAACFGIVIKFKEQEEALIKSRDELNIRVKERTKELRETNRKLNIEIAERNRAEEQTRKDLEEKKLLLAEIHHRVKNNMQVITSLINLQSRTIDDEKTIEMFNECKTRIRSMALIHEKLYQSKDFSKINIADYIQSLTNELSRSYEVDLNKIMFEMDLQRVKLKLDLAIPCGLVINELVSNAFKYAFPESWAGKGMIRLTLKDHEKKEIILTVQDNGVGFPKNFDIKKSGSLGLQIVTMLVEDQLKGTLKIERDRGAKFIIKFKR